MERSKYTCASCPFVLAIAAAPTSGGEPVEYFRNGDVGAFVATVPLAEDVDRATTVFSVESKDDSVYLLFSETPQQLHAQSAVRPRHERMLPPVDRARLEELKRQSQELDARKLELMNEMYANRGKLEGLRTLLAEEESKDKDGDATLIAKTRGMIEALEADAQVNKSEYDRNRQRDLEVQKEIWAINDGARERLPEEPGQRPEDQTRTDELNKQLFELQQDIGRLRGEINAGHQRVKGLQGLLAEEEAKGQAASTSFITRTRETIRSLKATIRENEAENQRLHMQAGEFQLELAQIRTGARERLPEAAAQLPVVIYGRFQGTGNPTITVMGRDSDESLSRPRAIGNIQLQLPAKDGGNESILAGWARARARYFANYVHESPYGSYYQFCLLQSVETYGLPASELPSILQRGVRPDRNPDLYSLTTGALAIQESLQLDAMTGHRIVADDRSIPLSTLEGPSIKSHPFEEMVDGRTPAVSPIAALIPHDAYYCSFASISKEIEASDLLEQWGTSLLRTLTISARDSDLSSKYQEQLGIGVSLLTRLFGDLVIGEIVLSGSDPFLREGTDLTVIIQVKDRAVFDRQMKSYANEALTKNSDAKSATTMYDGVEIFSITTADLRISSHSAYLGDHKVYSNSLDSLRRVIDTRAGRRTSMAQSPDFQYMRTIFPGGSGEDGFLFFSDAFIRKLIGPRWKIEAQRRIICQNHLRMIDNAATMYRTELRKRAPLEMLVQERYLSAQAVRCPDGGIYSLDPAGAACSVHNRLRYCTPVDSVALADVSKEEAQEYKAFVANYNRYWSQYFDPIGIRFRLGDRVEVETCILPLIENSIYNQLRDLAGGQPTALASRLLTSGTVLAVTTKLNPSGHEYAELLGELQEAIFPSLPPLSEAVGSSLSINLCDSDVLFTVDDQALSNTGLGMGLEDQLAFATILSAINLPVYVVLELKDPALAETIIRELLVIADARQRMQGRWEPWLDIDLDDYEAGTHHGHQTRTLGVRLFVIKLRLHYAIASDRLIVSTKRHVLENVLDAMDQLDSAPSLEAANLHVDIRPRAFDRLKAEAAMGWRERMRHACLKNLVPVRALIDHHGANIDTIDSVSRRVDGVIPRCPSGGAYQHDRARDLVYCTAHGDNRHPRQNDEPTGMEPFLAFLKRIGDLSITLRFTEDGIITKLAFDLDPVAR